MICSKTIELEYKTYYISIFDIFLKIKYITFEMFALKSFLSLILFKNYSLIYNLVNTYLIYNSKMMEFMRINS